MRLFLYFLLFSLNSVNALDVDTFMYRDILPSEDTSLEYEDEMLQKNPIIIPIGCDCFNALRLRYLGIRKLAYPFDWYRSSLDIIYNCLANDFDKFTDPKYIQQEICPPTHSIYGISFVHDFSGDRQNYSHEISLLQHKYKNRIRRLYKSLRIKKPIYFLWISPERSGHTKVNIEFNKIWLKKIILLLQEKFTQKSVTIIYADHSNRVNELAEIAHVKAFQIYHHIDNVKDPQPALNELKSILKIAGAID